MSVIFIIPKNQLKRKMFVIVTLLLLAILSGCEKQEHKSAGATIEDFAKCLKL